jgi:hypothetical protein
VLEPIAHDESDAEPISEIELATVLKHAQQYEDRGCEFMSVKIDTLRRMVQMIRQLTVKQNG